MSESERNTQSGWGMSSDEAREYVATVFRKIKPTYEFRDPLGPKAKTMSVGERLIQMGGVISPEFRREVMTRELGKVERYIEIKNQLDEEYQRSLISLIHAIEESHADTDSSNPKPSPVHDENSSSSSVSEDTCTDEEESDTDDELSDEETPSSEAPAGSIAVTPRDAIVFDAIYSRMSSADPFGLINIARGDSGRTAMDIAMICNDLLVSCVVFILGLGSVETSIWPGFNVLRKGMDNARDAGRIAKCDHLIAEMNGRLASFIEEATSEGTNMKAPEMAALRALTFASSAFPPVEGHVTIADIIMKKLERKRRK